jgi:hypothetical protein
MKTTRIWWVAMATLFLWLPSARAFYDPSAQRWINRDPIGEDGGSNLYGFVANDGVNRWDTLGLMGGWGGVGTGAKPGQWPGSPPPPPPADPGGSFQVGRDNCFCYALDQPGKPQFPDKGDGSQNAKNCKDLIVQIKKNYPEVIDVPKRFFGEKPCPQGYHKIAIFSDEGSVGFHAQRQDADGTWSEMSLSPDIAPRKCKRGDKGTDCGNLCAPDQPKSTSPSSSR